jgi:hypothetical protein
VDRSDTAKKAFASVGLAYTEAEVLQLELPNTPGALLKFARKLAQEDINITLGYATNEKGSKKTNVILAVSDKQRTVLANPQDLHY